MLMTWMTWVCVCVCMYVYMSVFVCVCVWGVRMALDCNQRQIKRGAVHVVALGSVGPWVIHFSASSGICHPFYRESAPILLISLGRTVAQQQHCRHCRPPHSAPVNSDLLLHISHILSLCPNASGRPEEQQDQAVTNIWLAPLTATHKVMTSPVQIPKSNTHWTQRENCLWKAIAGDE